MEGCADEHKRRSADRLDRRQSGHVQVARTVGAIEARKRLEEYDRIHRLSRAAALEGHGERAA